MDNSRENNRKACGAAHDSAELVQTLRAGRVSRGQLSKNKGSARMNEKLIFRAFWLQLN